MTDCEKKLRRMVDGIAEDVVQGRMRFFLMMKALLMT
jgi:hypothetical protein